MTPPPGPTRTRVLAVVLLAAAALLTALVVLRFSPLVHLDSTVVDAVNRGVAAHRGQVGAWQAVSAVLGPTVLRVLALLAVVVLALRRDRPAAALVAVVAVGGASLSAGLKVAVDRPRPTPAVVVDGAVSASYPSGHAMTSLLAAGVVVVLLAPRLRGLRRALLVGLVVLGVLAVAASRVALADHFPSDVLGGWLVGGAWLAVSVLLVDRLCPGVSPTTTGRAPEGR